MPEYIDLLFKTPDVADRALEGMSEEEISEWVGTVKKWVEYGEIVRIRIFKDGRAEVVPVK